MTDASPLTELQRLKADYVAAVKEKGQAAADYLFQNFLSEWPDVEAIRWEQYTPYFMDGDPCVFGVNEPSLKVNGALADTLIEAGTAYYAAEAANGREFYATYEYTLQDDHEEEGWVDSYNIYDDGFKNAVRDLGNAMQDLEDVLEQTFGDHSQVTVTRQGYDVSEYSHD